MFVYQRVQKNKTSRGGQLVDSPGHSEKQKIRLLRCSSFFGALLLLLLLLLLFIQSVADPSIGDVCLMKSFVHKRAWVLHTFIPWNGIFGRFFDTEIDIIVWYSEKFTNDFQDMVNSRFTWLGLVKRLPLKPIYFEPLAGTKSSFAFTNCQGIVIHFDPRI